MAEMTMQEKADRVKSSDSKASISIKLPSSVADNAEPPPPVIKSPVKHVTYMTEESPSSSTLSQKIPATEQVTAQSKYPQKNNSTDKRLPPMLAIEIIKRAWFSYRDRQLFKLLKHAICAAEQCQSHEVLKKISPKEAELLKDRTMRMKLRMRFGGTDFPPLIFFKIYCCVGNGLSVKYVSGKRMIQPASEAARDACDLMGHRKFYEQVIQDVMHQTKYPVTDEIDVTTFKDYKQYLSLLDETPSYLGGRDNSWRQLTLEVLSRQTIFYDVVSFLYTHCMSPQLKEELPALLSRPCNEDAQLEHIRIISQLRSQSPTTLRTIAKSPVDSATKVSSRRSKRAQIKARKMKKLYEEGLEEERVDKTAESQSGNKSRNALSEVGISHADHDEDWEKEADRLYEWTQELSFDELVATPRLNTAQYTMSY